MSEPRTTRHLGIGGITCLLILLVTLVSPATVSARPSPDETSASGGSAGTAGSSRLLEKAQREGSVRAIVGLRTDFTPEGRLSVAQAEDQREAIESAGTGLREELAGTGYRTLREYETVPYLALRLTPEALRAVQDSPTATTIQEDVAVPPDLAESSTIVQAPAMWETNLNGATETIAVLDTGVDRFHPFLGGRVVEEACFSQNSNCPNGRKTQTGTDSGAPCTYAARGCRHGTHVAGIAAGQGSDFSGVAPNANIMSVQVFSRVTGSACKNAGEDPCPGTFVSDAMAGLERVYQLRNTHTFSSVNMSFGGGRHTGHCDSDSRKAIIDNLRSAGIATVIASGNDGFTDAVNAPACISSAITVGNTTKRDTLAADSNMAPMVDLLAPGSDINSSVPGGGFASLSGTSMAAPHVAGAWALLTQKYPYPYYDVGSNLFQLSTRGTPVPDTRAGGTARGYRINIADAARVRLVNDDFRYAKALFGVTNSVNGINVAAIRQPFEPDHMPLSGSLGENSVWYRWTAPVSGPVTVDTCTSSFDTALAAYTGSDLVDGLSQVADNDDACNVPNHRGSKIAFDAVADTNYHIAVAGVEGGLAASEGTFTLNLAYDLPTNDNFANAQTFSGNSVNGTTVGATRETGEPDHYTNPNDGPSFIGEHTVWYSWTAPFTGQVEMNTCEDDPISSVLAVYTGSDLSTLNRVADDRNGCLSGSGSRVTFDATEGATYRIAVGNPDELSQNTFTLEVVDKKPPSVTSTSPANNATGIARGANVRATFSEPMRASTITASTFKLTRQGATSNVSAAVTYDSATNTATLNPNNNLTAGATYTATLTTQAKDLAGNGLDQNPSTVGNQAKSWRFKVQP